MSQAPTRVINGAKGGGSVTVLSGDPAPSKVLETAVWLAASAVCVYIISTGSASALNTIELIAILALFASGTNILVGHTGLLSFGQAAFYGEAAYTLGILLKHNVSLGLALVGSLALAVISSVIVGIVLLRTRHLYFALASLAVSQLAEAVAVTQYNLTGGNNGLFGFTLPSWLTDSRSLAWIIVLTAIAGVGIVIAVEKSTFGIMLRAVRDRRDRAASFGVPVLLYEVLAFAVAGGICGLAGCLALVQTGGATPDMLSWSASAVPVMACVIGGMYSISGPVIGAAVYEVVYTYATGGSADWEIVLGAILIGIVLFAPRGIADLAKRLGVRILPADGRRHD